MAGVQVAGMDLDALLAGIRGAESGGANAPDTATTGYTATNSGGMLGAYQFSPSTMAGMFKELGIAAPTPAQFLASHSLQDQAAAQYIKDGIAAGARTPVQIGEFWLQDALGIKSPASNPDSNGVTPLAHGLKIQQGYDTALGGGDALASNLANILGGMSTVNGEDPATGSSDNQSAAKNKQDATPQDPFGLGALTSWLTTTSHNLPLYVLGFVLLLGGFLWLASASGAVDKVASIAAKVPVVPV